MRQFVQDTNRKNLLQLLRLRTVAIVGQSLTIFIAQNFLEIELPLAQMFLVIGILSAISVVSIFRKNVSEKLLFIELIFDVVALAAQLYFSGGASNPFVSLFLLQVIIAAVLLEKKYAWMVTLFTVICYIWLGFFYNEIHQFHHHDSDNAFGLHLQGMLVSYVLIAILLMVFITRISSNLRERDQMIRTAMLATSAAHQLGTPLSTISIIVGDWKKMNIDKAMLEDVGLVELQLNRCKKIISEVLSESGSNRVEEAKDL